VTIDDLVRVAVERVVSAYETTFVTWGVGVGRSVNIRDAAERLDGAVLAPGEVFSFNDRVGPRTLERGFALAPEIQGDEMTTGVGGGTCQVSSTLHAAALFGALEIVERQPHSRPSSYTQMGLDATVSYPSADLKLRNTLPYPIMIHAFLPKPTAVRIELLGGDPIAKVDYKYGVSNTEDFVRRIKVMPNLPPGKRVRHQKGSRGYDVTSFATIRFDDGRVEERRWYSGYRPAPEVFWVAPGTADDDLPPLPEHAKGVEGHVAQGDGDAYAM
jgi:vancomycin resistance protein YoaR